MLSLLKWVCVEICRISSVIITQRLNWSAATDKEPLWLSKANKNLCSVFKTLWNKEVGTFLLRGLAERSALFLSGQYRKLTKNYFRGYFSRTKAQD